jgi:WXXGXW repeat (2 copies)
MTRVVATTFIGALLLISGSIVSAQTSVSVGIQIGQPPPPRVVYVVPPPPPPEPEYVWIEGYWYPVKHHYKWHDGYWTRPPYPGARWMAARYDGQLYFEGYWEGSRGRYVHDHRWDRDRDRDYREAKRKYDRRRDDQDEQ